MAFIIEAGLCVATNMEVFVFSLYLYSILVLNLRTRKVLPAIDNPLHNRDYHNNRECNDTVIYPVSQSRENTEYCKRTHATAGHRPTRRKQEQHRRESNIRQGNLKVG